MARDQSNETPLTSRDQLIGELEAGCKPKERWRLGTEHEKFVFRIKDHSPVAYDGENGIRRLLEGMEGLLGWDRIDDLGNIIGLADPNGGGAISLEPGGQFELSGAPVETIHDTCREVHGHLARLREIGDALGIGFMGVGASPIWSRAQTPVMPKSRYKIMTNYMPKVGTMGLDMMYRSCTIQVNLDFASEADMVKKMRVSLALQPIATALFANSPFLDGKPNGFLSYRSEIWRDTDNNRAGMLPFVFEEGYGFERYVDYALQVPMYFVKRGETYHDATHITFQQYLDGAMRDQLPAGDEPNEGDWVNHLSCIFPEVRLKRFLEMRGTDGGPWRRICALPALWVGLLYDSTALDAAWDLVKDWTDEERQALRDQVPVTALKTKFRDTTVHAIADQVVDIAREGLKARNRISEAGFDETQYLHVLEDIVALGETPAEEMLKRYHGDWQGDLERVFECYAY
ncbi:glutamate--cysteine ligase [Coralliovum pocilloporae]|uniref:glutamate--cysteine ligase n=1 Tax=Coralliovum pocilloporae TaxID=3066369 RepID=UPI003306C6F2